MTAMTANGPPAWPRRPALFLDLDGTLVELEEHPSITEATPRLRRLLPKLPEACGGAVAVISGRRIEDVDRILAPHVYLAAGVHGLERRGADGSVASFEPNESLAHMRRKVEPFVRRHAGVWIEDKLTAFAVHYRARPELEDEVQHFVDELQRGAPADVEILTGNRVFEIKPGIANKGVAIELFMGESPFLGRTPVFIGDDVTDEAGFQVVNAMGGVSVKVGPAPTTARWRLSGTGAVLGWLEQLVSAA